MIGFQQHRAGKIDRKQDFQPWKQFVSDTSKSKKYLKPI